MSFAGAPIIGHMTSGDPHMIANAFRLLRKTFEFRKLDTAFLRTTNGGTQRFAIEQMRDGVLWQLGRKLKKMIAFIEETDGSGAILHLIG